MTILADTHLLLWLLNAIEKVPAAFRAAVDTVRPDEACFSAASVWEVAIKFRQARGDFDYDPRAFRTLLIDGGWREVAVSGAHAIAVADLPPIHRDPFDRLLIAQARVEGLTLFTSDATVARYGGAIELV